MSVNHLKNYLIILFEDNAYKDLFFGFNILSQQMKIGEVFGGFKKIHAELTDEKSTTLRELNKYSHAYVLVLIDADLDSQSKSNIDRLKQDMITKYQERVFVLGSKHEAEHIKKAIIGSGKWKTLAKELENSCQNNNCEHWQHDMLRHNLDEIARLKKIFEWV